MGNMFPTTANGSTVQELLDQELAFDTLVRALAAATGAHMRAVQVGVDSGQVEVQAAAQHVALRQGWGRGGMREMRSPAACVCACKWEHATAEDSSRSTHVRRKTDMQAPAHPCRPAHIGSSQVTGEGEVAGVSGGS